jgi:DNA-binding NarL/FixJ family response regulator
MIRILVADDHPVVRAGLVAMLGTQPDFQVVGEAETGTQVIAQASRLAPDVILLDLEMPELDGVQVMERLRQNNSSARVVVFTAYDTDEKILGALQAGAKGYLLKGAPRKQVFDAIRTVNAGGSLLQSVVASKLIEQVSARDKIELTEREREVLDLLAQGKSNKQIADTLSITERTAKFHVSAIMSKLGASNRTEAVTRAARRGLIKLSAKK